MAGGMSKMQGGTAESPPLTLRLTTLCQGFLIFLKEKEGL